ncbi:MAG: cbb3-type cytochrome c oxidase subunit 3 [Comamonadaceae bacterium]|jgi:cytochrome c oxidase cbb3-type subunit IV
MDFDINSLRSLATVASFVVFVGILVWAFSSRKAADFEQAARLPFEQD